MTDWPDEPLYLTEFGSVICNNPELNTRVWCFKHLSGFLIMLQCYSQLVECPIIYKSFESRLTHTLETKFVRQQLFSTLDSGHH